MCRDGLTIVLVVLTLLSADRPEAAQSTEDDTVELNARGARFGLELCGFTQNEVKNLRTATKTLSRDVTDFDFHWNHGWNHEGRVLLQYQSLQASDRQEYAARVKSNCRRVRERVEAVLKSAAKPQRG